MEKLRHTLPPGTVLAHYRIERLLGEGGFGITYLALDLKLQMRVVIKEYFPAELAVRGERSHIHNRTGGEEAFAKGLKRFIDEARTLARFNHPSIVRILNFFEANHTAYFVMEYEEGIDLGSYLKRSGRLGQEELLAIIMPILEGLKEVHAHNFLHRDIKPGNILLRKNSAPVLIDFGASKETIPDRSRSVTNMLTEGYAPPEQYSTDARQQGPWTDLYAVGAVMYRMITGEVPVDSQRRTIGLLQHADPYRPLTKMGLSGYERGFLQAIDRALSIKASERPQSVREFQRELVNGKGSDTSGKPSSSRIPVGLAAGLVLFLFASFGGLYYAWPVADEVKEDAASQPVSAAEAKKTLLPTQEREKPDEPETKADPPASSADSGEKDGNLSTVQATPNTAVRESAPEETPSSQTSADNAKEKLIKRNRALYQMIQDNIGMGMYEVVKQTTESEGEGEDKIVFVDRQSGNIVKIALSGGSGDSYHSGEYFFRSDGKPFLTILKDGNIHGDLSDVRIDFNEFGREIHREEKTNTGYAPVYPVKLDDPRKILEKVRASQTRKPKARILYRDEETIHLGDESISGGSWYALQGQCYSIPFETSGEKARYFLKIDFFGVESAKASLNGEALGMLPPQQRIHGRRPNYWSGQKSLEIPGRLLQQGYNTLKICAARVPNPERYGDLDDFQIRNIQIVEVDES